MLVLVAAICALLSTTALAIPIEAFFHALVLPMLPMVPMLSTMPVLPIVPTTCIDGTLHGMRSATLVFVLVVAICALLSATTLARLAQAILHILALDTDWTGDTIDWSGATLVIGELHIVTFTRVFRHPLPHTTAPASIVFALAALLATAAMASVAQTALYLLHLHA